MDGTENEVKYFVIDDFPMIKLYCANNKKNSVDFDAKDEKNLTKEKFIQFLKKNAVYYNYNY